MQCSICESVTTWLIECGEFVHAYHEEIVAVGTIFIAVFTATLWRATNQLWEAGERQAKQTQQTIDLTRQQIALAREEFISANKPKIRIKHLRLANGIVIGKPMSLKLDVVNIGGTDALMRLYNVAIFVVPLGSDLPLNPPYYGKEIYLNLQRVSAGITCALQIECENDLEDQEMKLLNLEYWKIYCAGTIQYQDEAGRIGTTAFYRFLDPSSYRFRSIDNPDKDYEYED